MDDLNEDPTISDRYQVMLDAVYGFVDARDWNRFHSARSLALAIASEVGELAGELRWVEDERAIDRQSVGAEMADIQIFLLLLARRLELDLAEEVQRKVVANDRRYPAGEWKGRAGKA